MLGNYITGSENSITLRNEEWGLLEGTLLTSTILQNSHSLQSDARLVRNNDDDDDEAGSDGNDENLNGAITNERGG